MQRGRRRRLALAALLFLAANCDTGREAPTPPPPAPTPPPPAPAQRFARYPLAGANDLAALTDRYGEEGLQVILRLNRIDASHAWRGDTLIVPDPLPLLDDLSPFPARVAGLRTTPKTLLVSLRMQSWAAYSHGRRTHWGPTSTGKPETPTCPDLYYTNWKSKERRSTENSAWILRWVFNFENQGGCSFHVYDLPGRPASHACVRLLDEDAEWIYNWADQWVLAADESRILRNGTPVLIFGEFDFSQPAPWWRLPEDPAADQLGELEIEQALAAHAGDDALASRTREGLRIVAELDSFPAAFDGRALERDLRRSGPFVPDRIDLLARRAILWADADRRADFDSLRAVFAAHGFAVRDFLVDGWGRALRFEGLASFVSPEGERLFYIESRQVPGMNPDSLVWARFEGLVSVRGNVEDPHDAFRVLLSSARTVESAP